MEAGEDKKRSKVHSGLQGVVTPVLETLVALAVRVHLCLSLLGQVAFAIAYDLRRRGMVSHAFPHQQNKTEANSDGTLSREGERLGLPFSYGRYPRRRTQLQRVSGNAKVIKKRKKAT